MKACQARYPLAVWIVHFLNLKLFMKYLGCYFNSLSTRSSENFMNGHPRFVFADDWQVSVLSPASTLGLHGYWGGDHRLHTGHGARGVGCGGPAINKMINTLSLSLKLTWEMYRGVNRYTEFLMLRLFLRQEIEFCDVLNCLIFWKL